MHAAMNFAAEHNAEFFNWQTNCNSIITLSCKNEHELFDLSKSLQREGYTITEFFEPDIGYGLTSIAIAPCDSIKKRLSNLRLAGRSKKQSERAVFDICDDMVNTEQTPGQNIMEHGLDVQRYCKGIYDYFKTGKDFSFKAPPEFYELMKKQIHKIDEYNLLKYAIFHDLGKPYCLEYDENGKKHFRDHAKASRQKWLEISNNTFIADLIEQDMDLHTLKPEQVHEFIQRKTFPYLLLSCIAEINSNASMFGGYESESFKIKYKRLQSRLRKMLALLAEES